MSDFLALLPSSANVCLSKCDICVLANVFEVQGRGARVKRKTHAWKVSFIHSFRKNPFYRFNFHFFQIKKPCWPLAYCRPFSVSGPECRASQVFSCAFKVKCFCHNIWLLPITPHTLTLLPGSGSSPDFLMKSALKGHSTLMKTSRLFRCDHVFSVITSHRASPVLVTINPPSRRLKRFFGTFAGDLHLIRHNKIRLCNINKSLITFTIN